MTKYLLTIVGMALSLSSLAEAQDIKAEHGKVSAPAYFVAEYKVNDAAGLVPYREHVEATFLPYGGHFVARGGETRSLEGALIKGGIVVIEFPSFEKASAWYDSAEYGKLRPIRQRSAETRAYIVQGTQP
jgi:uncharacterized protein (DUF1330 family)